MSTVSIISRGLADLLPTVNSAEFSAKLVELINELVSISEASVIVYQDDLLPYFDYVLPDTRSDHPTIKTFIDGAFLLDPYYIAATRHQQFGFFRLRELAPSGFRSSEYYQLYYRHSGLFDECGYLIRTSEKGFVNIAFGGGNGSRFTQKECGLLADLAPIVEYLALQKWGGVKKDSSEQSSLRTRLETALGNFGRSKLTDREAQIIRMVLHGHTSKTIAAELGISVETVKLHRKNAYAKLKVKMQSELFYLFINSLMQSENYQSGDPLTSAPASLLQTIDKV